MITLIMRIASSSKLKKNMLRRSRISCCHFLPPMQFSVKRVAVALLFLLSRIQNHVQHAAAIRHNQVRQTQFRVLAMHAQREQVLR